MLKLKNRFYFQSKNKLLQKFYHKKRDYKIGYVKFQKINKKYFTHEKLFILQRQYSYQKKHKKMKIQNLIHKVIGGGCISSRHIYNTQKINFSVKKGDLDEMFIQNFEYFTNQENIVKNTKDDNIQDVFQQQMNIIKCLKQFNISIRNKITIYKPKLIQLIDVYLIYVLIGSSQKEVLMENEVQELGSLFKDMKQSFEKVSRENPTCDLIFYLDILYIFNSTRIGKDEQNKIQLIQAVEFMTAIVKLGSCNLKTQEGNVVKAIDEALQGTQKLIKQYQESKTNQFFSYLLDIWVRKTNQFKERIWNLTLMEEIQFYLNIFNELFSKNNQETDLVLLTLIKIDHYFGQAIEDQDNLQTFSHKLSLDCDLIKIFIPILIQKSDSWGMFDQIKFFLKFTVENHTYRFLTISILLKYNKIILDTKDSQDYKEQIMEYLCYKYLCEKDQSVKLSFETNREFADHFNSKIEKEEFKDKIIELSSERNKVLKIFELEKYEEKIENSQDIERMISITIIEKWERDVKRRQQENIAQKDDVLLEVIDLYIEQQITYLAGNKIFQLKQSQTQTNESYQHNQKNKNALKEILDHFFQVNVTINEHQNLNQSSIEEQHKCRILGIVAEGGTGKSMLIKKLETYLITIANSFLEKEDYIPLLIKCNSLDPVKPSIENYLLEQGVNMKQIDSIKNSDRNKVILLDGYDEFTGEYFRVYQKLNLNEWKNTKIIVTSRKEKLELSQACTNFSLDNDIGNIDQTSFCIVKLEEFTNENIKEYYERYFRKYRTNEETFDESQYKNDLDTIEDCIKNPSLENLLYLPINLYLFTRMIVQVKDKNQILEIKENISDQIGIQEIFFNSQFKREAQDFVQTRKEPSKRNKDFDKIIVNSFFEYFQQISIKMFLNKGKIANFLQIRKDQIKFKLQKQIENKLSQNEKNNLFEKIIHYVNSKIITRSKEDIQIEKTNYSQNKNYLIEFKHKSLFEYFASRAMKYDFDIHGDNIYKLNTEQLKEFNINKKTIMNIGQNQSEQQILIKLYKMINNEINSNEFYQSYHLEQIEKNSRYIQYIKKSAIKNKTETSQIDIGASNILSALFLSNYAYPKLHFNNCSFSKLYVNSQKSDLINFENCNLQSAYLKNLIINYDTCNTEFAIFDGYQKLFDTSNIFSFIKFIWDKNNLLYTITVAGFINVFKIVNQNIQLQKSKRLSQASLIQILNLQNDNLLVSTQYCLMLINSSSFDILQSYKFKNKISSIIQLNENILVIFENRIIFHGSFQNGFRKTNMIGSGCVFNTSKQILLVYSGNDFSIYNGGKNIEFINKIQGHKSDIVSAAFSEDGNYLATGTIGQICKIWNVEKGFELINTIQDHKGSINSIAFSADRKYLATGSSDQTCKIWNAEKGFELINTIQGHYSYIFIVAFSADGKYLATGYQDKNCKIWNVEKGFELINSIQGHIRTINSVTFSANGKYLATGSYDKSCKIWNSEKGFELINIIQGHTDQIFSVAFSSNGKYLVTGSEDESFKIWNVEKGFELIQTIQSHTKEVTSVAFSADSKYLATGSGDKSCKIWDVEKGFQNINTLQGNTGNIYSVTFSADGKYLATGSYEKSLIWNVEKGFELNYIIKGHSYKVRSVSFSGDGKYLATGSEDQTCSIWNVEKGFQHIKKIEKQHSQIYSVAFSADGKYLATGSEDKTCKIWNVEKSFELINTIQGHNDSIMSVAFSADGKYLATSSQDKTSKIWNIDKGFELINTMQGHTSFITSIAFSGDGKYLASSSQDKTCKIFGVEKGFEHINTIQGHFRQIYSVAFSANGKYLATGSADETCKIWNIEKGFELINTIQGHTGYVIFSVAFSSNGKYLATGSGDKSCKLWNVEKDFQLINTIQGHTEALYSIAFSTDGKYLATSSGDKMCKIWNSEKDFELIFTIKGHEYSIWSVAFSANGKYMATGSSDRTCKIWNAEKEFELIKTISGHKGAVVSIAFSVDGKYLLTGSDDNSCKIWNLEYGFELINTIQGHTAELTSVAFSADGKYLATGSKDKSCKIWNAEKGFQIINKIQGHISDIVSISFSSDVRHLKVQYKNQSQILFDLQNQKIIKEEINYEKFEEEYQFEQNVNKFDEMRIFENIFIL